MGSVAGWPVAGDGEDAVLVVDDEEAIRRLLKRLLERNGYRCGTAGSVAEARDVLDQQPYSVVFADITMPGGSGLELVESISAVHPDTACVMVTAVDDTDLARRALDLGAYGYIIKPFEPNEILVHLFNALRRRALEMAQRSQRERLEQMVKERTAELWQAVQRLEQAEVDLRVSREETIQRLSIAAEFRDDETARHIERMSGYCGLLAKGSGYDSEEVEMIRVASIMHDVGKIGIGDAILRKPGKFTDEERLAMQKHADIGFQILSGSDSPFLQMAASIALTHHEWFDGSGYPAGLRGDEIPTEGRIAAIADVFDALTSDRVYKRAFPVGKAVDTMREESGSHFDPELLEVFLGSMDEVVGIREDLAEA